jgi:hypothetical protein
MNNTTFPNVIPIASQRFPLLLGTVPPITPVRAGSSTSVRTISRSSTTSHPIAMRPSFELIMSRSWSARSNTTVLATDSDNPNMIPAPNDHPHKIARPAPSAVATMICVNAPGNATRRTAKRSRMEKCVPTPNISRITPISASCGARCASATKPGVNGPTTIPANRYPTSGGKRSRTATNPPTNANARLTAMVAISGTS